MAVNLYQTGVSGLMAAQQQLATTGHNIANVNTEGYSRQRAEQAPNTGIFEGDNYFGSGTYIKDVARVYSQFAFKEQLLSTSSLGGADSLHQSLNQLNDIMSYAGAAIDQSTARFYQAINGVADNPSDSGLRSIVLSESNNLANDFRSLNESFNQLEKAANGEIEQIAKRISEISYEIAIVNDQILQNQGTGTAGQPNDLLDHRDRLLTELGEYTNVNTVQDGNGVMTVMIGAGTTLVAGITPLSVQVRSGDPDATKTALYLVGSNSAIPLAGDKIGGALGAKIDFRDTHIAQARTEIDRLAMAISATLNQQQADGLDLNQLQGANLFTDINSTAMQQGRVLSPSTNSGNLQAQVNITDISLVPTDEFEIRFDGVNYQMKNLTNGAITNLGAPGSGTYATAFGFEFIETAGAPANDDSYLIQPTKNGAANMNVALNNGSGIAASSAVAITPSANNISAGKVEIVAMLDPQNARLAMPMRIDVMESPPGTFNYTYTDNLGVTSAPVAYTPPLQTIDLPPLPATALFKVEITGTPSGAPPNAPEQFFIGDAFGLGNGNNALAITKLQSTPVVNGGKETFSQSLSITTSKVGSSTKSAELIAGTAQALFTQAFNRNQEVSGVNLDEEAANMLKFQQAYQAASQIISVANTLFDSILAAVR